MRVVVRLCLFTAALASMALKADDSRNLSRSPGKDQSTISNQISAPTLPGTIAVRNTGGHVAANNYSVRVTFEGSGGGETTPSPLAGDNFHVRTDGSNSALYISAQEAPPGAKCFDAYVQTNQGAYYKQDGCSPLGEILILTTTPVRSGSTPPLSNTATAVVRPTPSSETNSVSAAAEGIGDPGNNQLFVNPRGATILGKIYGKGTACKTTAYGPTFCGWSLDWVLPNPLTPGQQAQGISSVMHIGGKPFYGGGMNLENPSAIVSGYFVTDHQGGPTSTWAVNEMCGTNGGSGSILCNEATVNNASGSDAKGYNGGVGFHCNSIGAGKPLSCFHVDGGNSRFETGLIIAKNCCDVAARITQGVNGNDTVLIHRNQDQGTTGTLIRATNSGGTEDLFSVSTTGDVLVKGGLRTGSSTNTDLAGHLTLKNASSASYNFQSTYQSAPVCSVTPMGDPGAGVRYWESTDARTLTVQTTALVSVTFSYVCVARN